MSFDKHVKNPLKWTSVVEASWHDLQGAIKRFDPEALAALELVLDIYNSGDHQWGQWATNFYEQHNKTSLLLPRVCSLLSIVMTFTMLFLRHTLRLRTQLASTFMTSLQQST